jgi:two-component system repressor protein LuxO
MLPPLAQGRVSAAAAPEPPQEGFARVPISVPPNLPLSAPVMSSVATVEPPMLAPSLYAASFAGQPVFVPAPAPVGPSEPEIMPLAEMERRLILAALRRTRDDVPRAAALLQINPSTIYRKLQGWRADGLIAD